MALKDGGIIQEVKMTARYEWDFLLHYDLPMREHPPFGALLRPPHVA